MIYFFNTNVAGLPCEVRGVFYDNDFEIDWIKHNQYNIDIYALKSGVLEGICTEAARNIQEDSALAKIMNLGDEA